MKRIRKYAPKPAPKRAARRIKFDLAGLARTQLAMRKVVEALESVPGLTAAERSQVLMSLSVFDLATRGRAP